MKLHYLFFYGVLGNEFIAEHRFGLPYPVGPVYRLRLNGGVPPRIQYKNILGRREVKSHTSCFQGDQEDQLGVGLLETVYQLHAVFGGTVKIKKRDFLPAERLSHKLQVFYKLAEYQCL
ncbi:hypothetical protein FQZ97_932560 [compost metagenome]